MHMLQRCHQQTLVFSRRAADVRCSCDRCCCGPCLSKCTALAASAPHILARALQTGLSCSRCSPSWVFGSAGTAAAAADGAVCWALAGALRLLLAPRAYSHACRRGQAVQLGARFVHSTCATLWLMVNGAELCILCHSPRTVGCKQLYDAHLKRRALCCLSPAVSSRGAPCPW